MQDESTHFGYQSIPTHTKTARVAEVFHSVAHKYDLMNDVMSFGLHRIWKKMAVQRCALRPNHTVLDLAGGTGDLAAQFANVIDNRGQIILSDINHSMLSEGRNRLLDKGIVKVQIVEANAEVLPFPNDYFHCVSMGFGLRNVTYKEKALSEIFRVLKPGGRVVILEFSHPKPGILNRLYESYSFTVLPILGQWICQDSESYRYLAESIRMHPTKEALKAIMENAGFEKVTYETIQDGIVALHIGYKF